MCGMTSLGVRGSTEIISEGRWAICKGRHLGARIYIRIENIPMGDLKGFGIEAIVRVRKKTPKAAM